MAMILPLLAWPVTVLILVSRPRARAVLERVGGREGCTHLVELFWALATAAYQTLFYEREQRERANPSRERPHIIDTCYTLRSDGEVIARRWPQFATKSDESPVTDREDN